jgi:Ca2+-binding EF-hand superfamily protein
MLKRRHLHNLAYQRKRLLARYNIDETDPAIIDEDVRATIVYDLKAQVKGFQMALKEKDIIQNEGLRAMEENLKRQMHTETEATAQRCESIISKYRAVAEDLTLRVATLEAELKIQKQRNKDNVEELSKHLQEDGAEELKQMFIDSTAPERLDSIVTSITNMSSPIIAAHAALRKRPTRKAPSLSPASEQKVAKNTPREVTKHTDKKTVETKQETHTVKKTVETEQETNEQTKDNAKDSLGDDMEKYLTRKIWKVYDPYMSGFISASKFKFMLEDFTHHTISTADCQNILNSLDKNNDGMIGKDELSVFIHDGILMNGDEREEYGNKSSLHKVIVEFFEGFDIECQAHATRSKEELELHNRMAAKAAERGAQHERELQKQLDEEKRAKELHDNMSQGAAERGAKHEKWLSQKLEEERNARLLHDATAKTAAEQGAQHEKALIHKMEEERNARLVHDATAKTAAAQGAQHEAALFQKMEKERNARLLHDAMSKTAAEHGAQHEAALLQKMEEEKKARQLHDAMARMAAEQGAQHEKTVFQKMEEERKAKQLQDAIAEEVADQGAEHEASAPVQQVEAAATLEHDQPQDSGKSDKRKTFKVGDRVRVVHAEWFGRYNGIVTSIHDGAYTVTFDDGDIKESLPLETVFPGENFTNGSTVLVQLEEWDEPFEGEIKKLIEDNGERFYNVFFPEDQTEEEVPEIAILNTVVR